MEFASARRAPLQLLPLALAALVLTGAGACRRRHEAGKLAPTAPSTPVLTARIAGSVVDGRAHPVPDARVLAFPIADGGTGGAEPRRARADIDGRFSIDGMSVGTYRVLVEAAGFPAAETSPVAAPASELVLRLSGEGRSVFGRVTVGGNPAAGVRVMLGAETGGPVRETQSRADGRFAFSGLGDGSYALRAVRG